MECSEFVNNLLNAKKVNIKAANNNMQQNQINRQQCGKPVVDQQPVE